MKRNKFTIAFIAGLIFLTIQAYAQVNTGTPTPSSISILFPDSTLKLHVNKITVTGNRKTKTYIIEREIQFKPGDSIITSKLSETLEQARQLVYNTTLFNEVTVTVIPQTAFDIDVLVDVKERWYVFPVPQFKWADRNFNEWVKTYRADFDRVNYGLKFIHYNLTGRKDQLRIFLLNGYSRNISFSYSAPYSNPKLTEGFSVGAGYIQSRQVPYKTSYDNRRLFYPDSIAKTFNSSFITSTLSAQAGYSIRRGYYNKHNFSVIYSNTKVADTILKPSLNPGFFNSNKPRQAIIDFVYSYQHVNVDNSIYTLKGKTAFIGVAKRGLGLSGNLNMLMLEAGYNKYVAFGKNWYGNYNLYSKVKLPFRQAYINQSGLGYGNNYLRGLDEYVVDGVVAGLLRTTLRKKVYSFNIPFPFRSRSHSSIPFTFYGKTFADAGFVYNKKEFDTNLNNRLLRTAGFGIDVLTLYDVNLRLEYSFNQLGQNGLFLQTQMGF